MTSSPHNHHAPEPGVLTRSEEQLSVTTEAVPVRRAVLRVETTTEQVMVPVTLTRQHVRLDYVDVDPATAVPVATDQLLGGATGGWLVLTADEPVITTRPVPVERVRLATTWATEEQHVQVELSHEQIDVDLPATVSGHPRH